MPANGLDIFGHDAAVPMTFQRPLIAGQVNWQSRIRGMYTVEVAHNRCGPGPEVIRYRFSPIIYSPLMLNSVFTPMVGSQVKLRSGYSLPPEPKAAADSYRIDPGPSFRDGLPSDDAWRSFWDRIPDPRSRDFAEMWHKRATTSERIPLRKDFGFRDLAKFGPHLALYKLTDENRWLTTFCGEKIVESVGIELTNKYLDEYADRDTLVFWTNNIALICDQGKPVIESYTLDHAGRDHSQCLSLNLPLRSGARDVPDMFICHETYIKYSAPSDLPTEELVAMRKTV